MAILVERRLRMIGRRLAELRIEIAVADEQSAHFDDETDEARLRSLMSETPLAQAEHREAERHSTAMTRHRSDLLASIQRLEAEQDELLDKLMARRRA